MDYKCFPLDEIIKLQVGIRAYNVHSHKFTRCKAIKAWNIMRGNLRIAIFSY